MPAQAGDLASGSRAAACCHGDVGAGSRAPDAKAAVAMESCTQGSVVPTSASPLRFQQGKGKEGREDVYFFHCLCGTHRNKHLGLTAVGKFYV